MTEEEIIMEMSTTTTTTSTNTLLPREIVMEILSWLPAKSLVSSFKFVCKAWSTIIKDPDFVKMHLNREGARATNGRSNNESLVRKDRFGNTLFQLHPPFNSEAKKMDIDSNLLILKSKLVGSCNGLLCLSVNEIHDETIVLLNPSTRKYKVSPEELIERRIGRLTTYGFGCYYNSVTKIDEYKVVRIADNPKFFKFQIDIYSMSSNSWRRWRGGVEDVPCGRFQEESGVFLNEAFHWICCKRGGYAWDTIVSFSIRDEKFGQVQMPPRPCDYVVVDKYGYPYIYTDYGITLMNVRGCLGKVYFYRTEMMDIELEIWVMKEYGIGESWTKELVIKSSDSDPPKELFANPIYSRSMTCFLAGDQIIIEGNVFIANQPPWFNDDLNFETKGWARGYGRRLLYDMNKKKIDGEFRMFDMPHKYYRDDQVDYIETLVSLKSSNNRKRKGAESLRNKPFEDIFYFKQ